MRRLEGSWVWVWVSWVKSIAFVAAELLFSNSRRDRFLVMVFGGGAWNSSSLEVRSIILPVYGFGGGF